MLKYIVAFHYMIYYWWLKKWLDRQPHPLSRRVEAPTPQDIFDALTRLSKN